MEAGWLARMRWRRRGAWLWPTFVVVTVVDGLIVHALPMAGSSQTVAGGVLLGLILNVLAVLFLSRPLGAMLRRRRGDLPVGVARNYAGTMGVVLVTVALLAIGLLHRSTIESEQHALDDATVRAEAFIGDHAPATFRANVRHPDTFAIEPGRIFRTCVPSQSGRRSYCVVVDESLPMARSVTFAGYEPNRIFAEGAD
ncbi:MAG TPA: hypothetical protein VGL51_07905 [Solirubrobacteraceae bacterium]|jgi:hypothetical protein